MNKRRIKSLFLHVLILIGSYAFIAHGIRVAPDGMDKPSFHIDEAHKIAETFFYFLLFKKNGTDHPAWTHDFYARTNPPVAKYIFGAALSAYGYRIDSLRLQQDFEHLWKTPEALRGKISTPVLSITRRTSAFFGSLVCLLCFWMCRRAESSLAGIIVVFLLLGSNLFLDNSRHGLTDILLIFFLLLTVPAVIGSTALLRQSASSKILTQKRFSAIFFLFLAGLIGGAAIALSTGVKLTGGLSAPIFAFGLPASILLSADRSQTKARSLLSSFCIVILSMVVAVAVFISINPSLFHEPFHRITETMDIVHDWLIKQQVFPGEPLFGIKEKLAMASYTTMGDAVSAIGAVLGKNHRSFFPIGMLAVVAAAGLLRLLWNCLHRDITPPDAFFGRVEAAVVSLVWICITSVGITIWLPLDWDRYLLPVTVALSISSAVGLSFILKQGLGMAKSVCQGSARISRMGIFLFLLAITSAFGVYGLAGRMVNPAWLAPKALKYSPKDMLVELYAKGVTENPEDVLPYYHLGLELIRQNRQPEAVAPLAKALFNADRFYSDKTERRIIKSRILLALAIAYSKTGDIASKDRMLIKTIELLGHIKSDLKSDDPKTRETCDQLISSWHPTG